jgi:hypothetical protein
MAALSLAVVAAYAVAAGALALRLFAKAGRG